MVLHFGEDDEITSMDIAPTPTISDQINTLRSIARKDDLFALLGIEKASQLQACPLHGRSGFLADLIHTAMHVGIVGLIIGSHRLDNRARLLRSGGAIKIDQWLAMHQARQNGKIGTERGKLVFASSRRGGLCLPHGCHSRYLRSGRGMPAVGTLIVVSMISRRSDQPCPCWNILGQHETPLPFLDRQTRAVTQQRQKLQRGHISREQWMP